MMPPGMAGLALETCGIRKSYGDVAANDGLSLRFEPGAVHAIAGENGAGKSTFARIVSGLLRPDEGTILVDGREARFRSPLDAQAAGIFLVAQEIRPFERLTALQNLLVSSRDAARSVEASVAAAGFDLPLHRPAAELSPFERVGLEMARAVLGGARALLLDEPTARLLPDESERLLSDLGARARLGLSVVLVTHRVREILRFARRVTVLHRGREVETLACAGLDASSLSRLLVGGIATGRVSTYGGDPMRVARPRSGAPHDAESGPRLEIRDVHVRHRGGDLRGVSLDVRAGEVVGVAGAAGSGRAALAEVAAGALAPDSGTVRADGADLGVAAKGRAARSPRLLARSCVAYLPADRDGDGLLLRRSVLENLALGRAREAAGENARGFAPGHRAFPRARFHALARAILPAFGVRPADPSAPAEALSGGNRQRLLVARETTRRARVLVAASPSQGLDPAGREVAWGAIRSLRDYGGAALVASEDLDELLALGDRIVVLHAGEVAAVFDAKTLDEESLGRAIGGAVVRTEARA
jgi:simple sugar transport system ATP-binding protein